MVLTEKVKINRKFQEDNLAWNDLQLTSLFMQSYQEFPNLYGIFGASQKNDLKSALIREYQNKPCYLENPVVREPCQQRTACRRLQKNRTDFTEKNYMNQYSVVVIL